MGDEFGSWFIISGFYMLKHVFLVSVCSHGLAFSSPFLVCFYVSLLLLLLLGTMVCVISQEKVPSRYEFFITLLTPSGHFSLRLRSPSVCVHGGGGLIVVVVWLLLLDGWLGGLSEGKVVIVRSRWGGGDKCGVEWYFSFQSLFSFVDGLHSLGTQ
jgi:hypothetical protein